VLCNCNLISEGITLPTAGVGLLLRPTLSLTLYIEQAMRCLTPSEGKRAIIIDSVNSVQRHGMPTQDRDWSLTKKVKEYDNENEDGTLKIRVCQECFSTFETAPVCPYCGAVYETTDVEIQNFRQIELKKIEEDKEKRRQEIMRRTAERVKDYTKPEQCKTFYELVEYGKIRGFKSGWAYIQAKRLHLVR
jgi:superfamily II DNA or RNA helicase